jgi:formate/nitrite transporter
MNSPPEIAKAYVEAGIKKVNLPILKMFILGIYAGLYIASGGVCASCCSYRMSGGDGRFYSGFVFPIGLNLCLCAGAELFTGNCLLVIPLLCGKITIIEMLISWGIVYLGNFIGGLIMALLIVYGHVTNLFDSGLAQIFVNTGIAKTTISFGDAFVKGILCNFFVCLAVWLSFGAKDLFSKIAALWTPILLFIACGFEHCVANMFYIPCGLFASYEYKLARPGLNWGRYLYKNLIPVTLGNICGGAILVGFGYWYIYLTPSSVITPVENRNPPIDEKIGKAIEN